MPPSDTTPPPTDSFRRRKLLGFALAWGFLAAVPVSPAQDQTPAWPDALIGYTEYRTNLPGGRPVSA